MGFRVCRIKHYQLFQQNFSNKTLIHLLRRPTKFVPFHPGDGFKLIPFFATALQIVLISWTILA